MKTGNNYSGARFPYSRKHAEHSKKVDLMVADIAAEEQRTREWQNRIQLEEAARAKRQVFSAEEDWICRCGNTADADGFYPCLEDGTQVEPTPGGDWTHLYRCGGCLAIAARDEGA